MKKIVLLSTLASVALFAVAPKVISPEKRSSTLSQFVPDISAIVDFSYVNQSLDNNELETLRLPGSTEPATNANNGFNLNYLEMVLSSNVDPYFSMDAVLHFSTEEVEVEEAYFTSTALEHGLRLRGGKLLSEFGRINQQHEHFWDFAQAPLVSEAFFGAEGLNEIGAQLQWVAPTKLYLMVGTEALQGTNDVLFGNAQITDPNSPDILANEEKAPSLFVGYIKSSFDIGHTSVLPGISLAQGSTRLDRFEESANAFSGNSSVFGAELTAKHFFNSYRFLAWQSEWMTQNIDGTEYDASTGTTQRNSLEKERAGFYTQLVYAHDQNWRFGVRYDNLYQNDITLNGIAQTTFDPSITNPVSTSKNFDRYSVMSEYHFSEFSRIRLEYDHNSALYSESAEKQNLDTISLQFNLSIGAHAAHDF